MHDLLTELLDQEVVGCIARHPDDPERLVDVSPGRICLPQLDAAQVEQLVARLGQQFAGEMELGDRMHLDRPEQLVRGVMEVTFHLEGGGYLLQISTHTLFAFYERRFWLEPDQLGDLCGTLCHGLGRLVSGGGQAPLRLLSGYDELEQSYLECLDAALQASVEGQELEPEGLVAELVEPVGQAWRMIPWPLRETLTPLLWPHPAAALRAPHQEVLRRSVLLATNVERGELTHEHVQAHHPLEDYGATLGWMLDLAEALARADPPPKNEVAVARASSAERFLQCFPGFSGVVDPG